VLLETKKVEGHNKKKEFTALLAGSVPPTFAPDWCPSIFKFVPAPLFASVQLEIANGYCRPEKSQASQLTTKSTCFYIVFG